MLYVLEKILFIFTPTKNITYKYHFFMEFRGYLKSAGTFPGHPVCMVDKHLELQYVLEDISVHWHNIYSRQYKNTLDTKIYSEN